MNDREEALWWLDVEQDLDQKFGIDLGTAVASRLQDFEFIRPDSVFPVADMLTGDYYQNNRLKDDDFSALAEVGIISVEAAEEAMFNLDGLMRFSESGDFEIYDLNPKSGGTTLSTCWPSPIDLEEIYGEDITEETYGEDIPEKTQSEGLTDGDYIAVMLDVMDREKADGEDDISIILAFISEAVKWKLAGGKSVKKGHSKDGGKFFRTRMGRVIEDTFNALLREDNRPPSAKKVWNKLKSYDREGVIVEMVDDNITWETANRAMADMSMETLSNKLVKLRKLCK